MKSQISGGGGGSCEASIMMPQHIESTKKRKSDREGDVMAEMERAVSTSRKKRQDEEIGGTATCCHESSLKTSHRKSGSGGGEEEACTASGRRPGQRHLFPEKAPPMS